MATSQISNPYGVNSQYPGYTGKSIGNIVYTDTNVAHYATDSSGNVATVSSLTAGSTTTVTTSAAHGFIVGQPVTIAGTSWSGGSGTTPVTNGSFKVATVGSSTTFTIAVVSTGWTGAVSSATATQLFQVGQVVSLQGWSGTTSSDATSDIWPTVGLTGISSSTSQNAVVGVIVGGTGYGSAVPLGGIASVCTSGICQAYINSTSTVLQGITMSATTIPGTGLPGSFVAGKNLGVALQAVTVASAYLPQLCQVLVRPS